MRIAFDIGANIGNCTDWFLSERYATTLSQLIEDFGSPEIIKIDVEGGIECN